MKGERYFDEERKLHLVNFFNLNTTHQATSSLSLSTVGFSESKLKSNLGRRLMQALAQTLAAHKFRQKNYCGKRQKRGAGLVITGSPFVFQVENFTQPRSNPLKFAELI